MSTPITNTSLSLIATAVLTLSASSALAADAYQLVPLQAHVTHFNEHTSVAYYTVNADGSYEVVTTVSPDAGIAGVSSRQRVRLTVGQTYTLELDQGYGNSSATAISIAAMPEAVQLSYQ